MSSDLARGKSGAMGWKGEISDNERATDKGEPEGDTSRPIVQRTLLVESSPVGMIPMLMAPS